MSLVTCLPDTRGDGSYHDGSSAEVNILTSKNEQFLGLCTFIFKAAGQVRPFNIHQSGNQVSFPARAYQDRLECGVSGYAHTHQSSALHFALSGTLVSNLTETLAC